MRSHCTRPEGLHHENEGAGHLGGPCRDRFRLVSTMLYGDTIKASQLLPQTLLPWTLRLIAVDAVDAEAVSMIVEQVAA